MAAIIAMKKCDTAKHSAVFLIWRRKAIATLFFAVTFLCAGLLCFDFFAMAANEDTAVGDVYVLDNLWDGAVWIASDAGTTLSREEYTAADINSAADETDYGYLSLRRETARAGAIYSVSTSFNEPVNLYEYQSIELRVKADTLVFRASAMRAKC